MIMIIRELRYIFIRGIDIRDIACDGYGFTADTSGMNRYMSKYLKKLEADTEKSAAQSQEEQQKQCYKK